MITATVFATKIKYIPIIVTTNKEAKTNTATQSSKIPDVLPPIIEEQTATPSWLIATPTASITIDIGGKK